MTGVFKIDPITKGYIEVYRTALEAAEANDCWDSHIIKCCKGLRKTAGGWAWEYVVREVDIKE